MKRKHKLQLHPNGQYGVRIMRDGVSKNFFFGTNKRAAEKELEQIEIDVSSGRIAFSEQETTFVVRSDGSKDIHVKELAVKHLAWVKANRAPGTFRNRQHFVLQFLDFVGEAMVSDITRLNLEEYYAWAKQNRSRSANGGNEALANVKTLLLWGEEMELYALPFRKFPRMCHVQPETKRIFDDDLLKLLQTADYDFRDMLLFGLMTGLRPKELMGLGRQHFRQDGNGQPYVIIERHKTSRSARNPKPRTVPLSPLASEIYRRQAEKHPESEFAFLNDAGTPFTRHVFKRKLERLCRRAKTSRIYCPYSLRHTFASMESDGGDIETTALARLMGHTTTRTLDRYVTNTSETFRRAVTSLATRIEFVVANGTGEDKTRTKVTTRFTTCENGQEKPIEAAIATRSVSAS